MGFCDLLKAHGIDPAKFIALQNEMIGLWLKNAEQSKETSDFKNYVERDQIITQTQKFINILERERVQQKINEVSNTIPTQAPGSAT